MRKNKYKIKNAKSVFLIIGTILLFLYTLSLFMPFVWAFSTSFKSFIEFSINPMGFPKKWEISNYSVAFNKLFVDVEGEKVYFDRLLFNSVVYSLLSAIMLCMTPCITAYACSRFKFKIGKIIYMVALVTFFLPIVGSLPSELQLMRTLNLFDSLIGLVILKGHFTGLYFFIFYSAFQGLPRDYEEAAYIDGASRFSVLVKINLPLMKATILAVFILCFVACWNEYTTPMLFLPSFPTASLGLYKFQFSSDQLTSSVPMQMCACFIVILPVLIMFLLFKNQMMGNVAVGGVKG